MTHLLLILHFMAFSIGIGAGIANLVIGKKAAVADPAARPAMGAASMANGRMATGCLVLLWLTGIAMVYLNWDGWGELPPLFWVKFAAVLVLTGCSAVMNLHVMRAQKSGTPPPPATMMRLGQVGAIAGLSAVALAVLTFAEG